MNLSWFLSPDRKDGGVLVVNALNPLSKAREREPGPAPVTSLLFCIQRSWTQLTFIILNHGYRVQILFFWNSKCERGDFQASIPKVVIVQGYTIRHHSPRRVVTKQLFFQQDWAPKLTSTKLWPKFSLNLINLWLQRKLDSNFISTSVIPQAQREWGGGGTFSERRVVFVQQNCNCA